MHKVSLPLYGLMALGALALIPGGASAKIAKIDSAFDDLKPGISIADFNRRTGLNVPRVCSTSLRLGFKTQIATYSVGISQAGDIWLLTKSQVMKTKIATMAQFKRLVAHQTCLREQPDSFDHLIGHFRKRGSGEVSEPSHNWYASWKNDRNTHLLLEDLSEGDNPTYECSRSNPVSLIKRPEFHPCNQRLALCRYYYGSGLPNF